MQDAVHAIGASGGIFFGGGDRRLRPHSHHQQQALKCPRCDSPNTKFCYYNNYNLSQPRHFCKSCRRYWTNGGVLRNVPVGGGCRKSKGSSTKSIVKQEGTVPTQLPADDSIELNKSSTTTMVNSNASDHHETKTTVQREGDNNKGLLSVSTEDHQSSTEGDGGQQVSAGGDVGVKNTTTTAMAPSSEEIVIAFDNIIDHPTTTTSYAEDQFKEVDYDQGLFDLTAAVDPSYWNDDQSSTSSSLNFLP